MIHELKCDPEPFDAVSSHRKLFELRKADRPFRPLDVLHLRETRHPAADMARGEPLIYTGREVAARVTHVMNGPCLGLAEGWAVISIVIVLQDRKPLSGLETYDLATAPIGCAACDRGDFQLGHADDCPKVLEAVFTELTERFNPNDGTFDPALPHHLLP